MAADVAPNRIRELRDAAGLSMDGLAARCSPPTSASQINKLEKGHVNLTTDWMRRLAAVLGVDPVEILAPIPKLTPIEQALVAKFRELDEPDRVTVYRVADAMAQTTTKPRPETPPSGDNDRRHVESVSEGRARLARAS